MNNDHTPPALPEAVDDLVRHGARLRRALGWLRVLTEPGREPPRTPPLLSDAQLERRAQDVAAEAAGRAARPTLGWLRDTSHTALAPTPAPLAVGLLDAQVRVGRVVRRAAARAAGVLGVRCALPRPQDAAGVAEALDWLAGDGPVWVVDPAGVARRRGAGAELPNGAVAVIGRWVADAGDGGLAAAGISADRVMPFPGGRCPACAGRALELDATLPQQRYWVVRCISLACRCCGPGCGCAQRVRYEGRRHAWAYGEFTDLQRAIAARGARPRVRRSAPTPGRSGRGW